MNGVPAVVCPISMIAKQSAAAAAEPGRSMNGFIGSRMILTSPGRDWYMAPSASGLSVPGGPAVTLVKSYGPAGGFTAALSLRTGDASDPTRQARRRATAYRGNADVASEAKGELAVEVNR